MQIQTGFDRFVEATRYMFRGPSPQEIFIFLVVFSLFLVMVSLPLIYLSYQRKKTLRNIFFSRAKDYDLTEYETEMLWKYVSNMGVNPTLIFESKTFFEKVVSKVVEGGNREEIKTVPSIRTKLRYDTVPWFIPLTTTKDIDLYQTGTVIIGNTHIDAYVYDKDEEFLYIALLEPYPIKVGERITFFFIRENDARYSFEAIVDQVFTENERTIIAIKHTDKLYRVQLRENIRWKTHIPAKFTFGRKLEDLGEPQYDGIIEDISVKGARLCFEDINLPVKENYFVLLEFTLKGYKFKNLIGRVMHKILYEKKMCVGIKFEEISRQEEKAIEHYILEEQRKLIKMYKLGESQK